MSRVGVGLLSALVGTGLAVAILLVALHGSDGQGASELLYGRSAQLAEGFELPPPKWNTYEAQEGLQNNIGAANLKIDSTIQKINSIRHEPELAAALHMIETSNKKASNMMDDLETDRATLSHTPVLPDPDSLISRLHRLRLKSAWCHSHPEACFQESEPVEAGSLSAAKSASLKPKAAHTQELWNEPDDNTQLFTDKDISRMPWLASYAERRKKKLEEDPLWCGASHCEERGYARHKHLVAQAIPHAIAVNEPLEGRSGGTIETDPHEKQHFSYARAPRAAGGLQGAALKAGAAPAAREEQLAEVVPPGGLTAAGRGDSLLPHGPLWGLRNGGAGAVRIHTYPGFYDGSQPDRAATESSQQAASEGYTLEEKELTAAWNHLKSLHLPVRPRRRAAAHKAAAFQQAYEKGAALMAVAGSAAGATLPKLRRLEALAAAGAAGAAGLPRLKGESMSVLAAAPASDALQLEVQQQGKELASLNRLESQLKF